MCTYVFFIHSRSLFFHSIALCSVCVRLYVCEWLCRACCIGSELCELKLTKEQNEFNEHKCTTRIHTSRYVYIYIHALYSHQVKSTSSQKKWKPLHLLNELARLYEWIVVVCMYGWLAGWLPACLLACLLLAGMHEDDVEQQHQQQQLKEFIEYKISTKMRWNYGHTLCIRVNRTPKKPIHLIWAWVRSFARSHTRCFSCVRIEVFGFSPYIAHFNLKRLYADTDTHAYAHIQWLLHHTHLYMRVWQCVVRSKGTRSTHAKYIRYDANGFSTVWAKHISSIDVRVIGCTPNQYTELQWLWNISHRSARQRSDVMALLTLCWQTFYRYCLCVCVAVCM